MGEVAARGDSEIAQENQNRSTTVAVTGAMMIRHSMRNPHTFELTQVLRMGDGALCYTYRAQNGFGGHGPGPIGLGARAFSRQLTSEFS